MGEELRLLTDIVEAYPDQVALTGVHFGVKSIEKECRRIREDVIPKLKNDLPLCVGSLLDATA